MTTPRRVVVILELDTEVNLFLLRLPRWWQTALRCVIGASHTTVQQVQVNVIRQPKPKRARRR